MSLPEFDEVNKYPSDTYVLKDVDLNVGEGGTRVVIDLPGSGKSMLLHYANRFEEIQGGEIRLGDQSISAADTDISRLRQHIGMVFQSFNLFPHKTAWENVALASTRVKGLKEGGTKRRVDELLDRVDLGAQSNSYPNQLSGGQQQRVAIARVLAMDPRVILFDEVTSALDPELVGKVPDVMHGLTNEGMMIFVVIHEMGPAREASDRIILMTDGGVVESSPPETFFGSPKTDRGKQFLLKLL